MIRPHLAAAALAVALSACSSHEARVPQTADARYASLDAVASGTLGRPLSPARTATPIVVLPSWIGRPNRLREREDAGTLEQVVSLDLAVRSEARENLVLVKLLRSEAPLVSLTDDSAPTMGRPTEAGIRAEIAAAFPGIAMQVVARPAKNAYGSYGLAVGRSARGARCLYAWQWIEDGPVLDGARAEPVSLRVRLCRDDIGLDAMAAAVNQIRLVPRFAGEAVTAARDPSVRSVRRRPIRVAAAKPPRSEALLRMASPRPEAMAERQPAPATDRRPERMGRRYLGDDIGPVAENRPLGPSVSAGASLQRILAAGGSQGGASPTGLTADLPPEAYRGPVSRP